jgi:hypothetical protein
VRRGRARRDERGDERGCDHGLPSLAPGDKARVRLLLLPPVAALALAAGCGTSGGESSKGNYPSGAEETFQSGCEKQAANAGAKGKIVRDYCACTFAYIEKRLTYDEFKEADKQISDQKQASPKAQKAMRGAIAHCRPKTQ